jgi:predicted nucleic acid-binding protein
VPRADSSKILGPTVVVDANVIVQSPRLSSGAWRAALYASAEGSITLCVPEVAVLEAVGWLKRELPARLERSRRAASQFDHVGVRLDEYGDLDGLAAQLESSFETYLRDRLSVIPIPDVDHRTLVDRAIRRTRPFNQAGSGYRDALIWENVCHFATERQVILVSDNSKDFGGGEDTLAADLLSDLERRDLAPESVMLSPSLLAVVKIYVPEATDARRLVERVLQGERARRQLEEEFADAFVTNEGVPLARTDHLHPLMLDATVESVSDLDNIELHGVKATGDATYLVVGRATALARVYFIRERIDFWDIDAARAGIADGRIEEAFQRGEDLVLTKHLPVVVEFQANVEPGDLVSNAGVVDAWPIPRGSE